MLGFWGMSFVIELFLCHIKGYFYINMRITEINMNGSRAKESKPQSRIKRGSVFWINFQMSENIWKEFRENIFFKHQKRNDLTDDIKTEWKEVLIRNLKISWQYYIYNYKPK